MATYKQHLDEEVRFLAGAYGEVLETLVTILEEAEKRDADKIKELKPKLFFGINETHRSIKRLNNLVTSMPDGPEIIFVDNNNRLGI